MILYQCDRCRNHGKGPLFGIATAADLYRLLLESDPRICKRCVDQLRTLMEKFIKEIPVVRPPKR